MQTDHQHSIFKPKKWPIILVCDQINKAPNIGSLFRIADAFGIEKIIFCGENIHIGRRMTKTSRATEKVVNFELSENSEETINDLKMQGYQIVSLEITTDSVPIDSYRFTNRPIALVIGDENHGVSSTILEQSNATVHITMYGHNSSMNVVQATSIALYEITNHLAIEK